MASNVNTETVQQVARLARIDLSDARAKSIGSELSQILDYVQQLNQLELDDIEPFFGVAAHSNRIRADKTTQCLSRSEALKNAPDSDGEYYRVPPVFG